MTSPESTPDVSTAPPENTRHSSRSMAATSSWTTRRSSVTFSSTLFVFWSSRHGRTLPPSPRFNAFERDPACVETGKKLSIRNFAWSLSFHSRLATCFLCGASDFTAEKHVHPYVISSLRIERIQLQSIQKSSGRIQVERIQKHLNSLYSK